MFCIFSKQVVFDRAKKVQNKPVFLSTLPAGNTENGLASSGCMASSIITVLTGVAIKQ